MGTIDAFQRQVWSPQFKQNCFPHRSKMGVLKSFLNTPRSSARGLIGIEREFRSAPLVYPRFALDFLPVPLLQAFRSRAASRRAFLHPRPPLSHTFRAVAHCRAGGVRPSCAPHAGLMHARCASSEGPAHLHAPQCPSLHLRALTRDVERFVPSLRPPTTPQGRA